MALEFGRYKAIKSAGGAAVARLSDDVAVISVRKFDPDTGNEAAPQLEQFSIKTLEEQLVKMKEQVASMEEFIADLKAADLVANKLQSKA